MRTTLQLDDDVYQAAKALAETEKVSLGRVVSRLVRRGLSSALGASKRTRSGFPVIRLPPGSPPVTSEMVRSALEESSKA